MTAAEFGAALAALDLMQVTVAQLFGRAPRSVQRWVAGDRAIPPEAAILVRLMLAGKITPDDLSPEVIV
jgi:DNA-binding transcriptional regulator YdaS (Cro superfamily)